ncbi:chaplin [Streptomyces adelaidensis]|uniref:chaplin n=1 Tax=Streptomyces adelaidensis TaxID=2796465 RepID=UPI0027DB8A36|nr:chaplin [Streptomyces adelaidensis]
MRHTLSKGMVAAAAATGILSLYSSSAFAESDATGAAEGSPGVLSGNSVQAPVHIPINVCGNTVDIVGVGNPAFGNACVNEDSASPKFHDAPTHGSSGHDDGKGAHGPSGEHKPSEPHGPAEEHAPWDAPGPGEEHDPSGMHKASGASADGEAQGSPGVLSGNSVQAPVHVPVNVCGNTVDVIAALNPAFGNECVNTGSPKVHDGPPEEHRDTPPDKPRHQPPTTPRVIPPAEPPTTPPGKPSVTPPANPAALAETGSEGLLAASAAGAALIAGGAIMYRRSRVFSRR